MNKQYSKIRVIVSVVLLSSMFQGAYADGYRNPPPTAVGLAKANAHSVYVDDASAMSYNPANLSLQTNASVVAGVTAAQTEYMYTNPFVGVPFTSDDPLYVLPNLYFSKPVGDKGMAVGLAVTTPYGQGTKWHSSDFLPFVGFGPGQQPIVPYEAYMMTININPTIAFKVNESVYLGVGLDFVYSQLELKSMVDSALIGPPGTVLYSEGEGDGWGFGANAGLTWIPTEGQRATLTYRSQYKVEYDGDFKVNGADIGSFNAETEFPNTLTVGYGVELSKSIQAEVMVEWVQWSVNDTLPVTAAGISSDQVNNWDDIVTFGFGTSWTATDWLMVHAGYAYIPSPVPDETITTVLPDADRHALGIGLGFSSGGHMVDLAFSYSIFEDRAAPLTGALPGTYEIDPIVLGLTYSYSF